MKKYTSLEMTKLIAQEVSNHGGHTYYVGGYVRDQLLHIDNKDIDIEIHGISVDTLESILDSLGGHTEMGASFGIFGLKGYDIDIAMPRSETAIGSGHKDFKVEVNPYLGTYKAAMRRDFTINSLMQDVLTDEIIDHFNGLNDLKEGIIRHVNATTFVEDPLRVLRAAQFASRFEMKVAPETIELSKTMNLKALASERILGELNKALLKSKSPSRFFEVLRQMNQLSYWFKEVEDLIDTPQNPIFHPEGDVWNHTMLVLDEAAKLRNQVHYPLGFMMTALMHDLGKPSTTTIDENGRIRSIGHEKQLFIVRNALKRITNEKDCIHYVLNMTELHMRPNQLVSQHARQKSFNKVYDQSVDPWDLNLFSKADHLGRTNIESYEMIEKELQERLNTFNEIMAKPYVTGQDLIQNGIKPGKDLGILLAYSHKLRLSGVNKDTALIQTLTYYKTNVLK